MRIVAGKFRGRILAKSDHLKSLRPTTDKNREAIFNILSSAKFIKKIGFKIDGAKILDVCCGSGAFAFEALSRGADSAVLIENNFDHLKLAKRNSEILSLQNEVKILQADAKALTQNEQHFDLIFIDPPYAENYKKIVENLSVNNWIDDDSLVVIEFKTFNRQENFVFCNLDLLESRSYGKSSFGFYVKSGKDFPETL